MPRGRVLCIGGATVDRRYRLAGALRPETSNPATGRQSFGGVARNVAEAVARLGGDVGLLSYIGDDESGRALVEALQVVGVDTRGVAVVPGASTAEYVAVLTIDGDLAFGIADMAILDRLGPAALERRGPLLAAADWVFADCNLPAESLAALAERSIAGAGYRLVVDPVSVAKSARLPDGLNGIDLLVLNQDEAAAVLARLDVTCDGPWAQAAALRRCGAAEVVLSLGREGALVATRDGVSAIDAVPAKVIDVTGAGDSLIAGVLFGSLCGLGLADAVRLGCRAASRTVGCAETVSPALADALDVRGFDDSVA